MEPVLVLALADDVARKRQLAERFFRLVKRGAANEHWAWLGTCNKWNTPRVRLDTAHDITAVRLAWLLVYGAIPFGCQLVRPPGCVARRCVNPAHATLDPAIVARRVKPPREEAA